MERRTKGRKEGKRSTLTENSSLFFIDKSTVQDDEGGAVQKDSQQEQQASLLKDQTNAAWEDEDDKELQVDLNAEAQTRKLRHTMDETVLTGEQYSLRLKEHFERLHPPPLWARAGPQGKADAVETVLGNQGERANLQDATIQAFLHPTPDQDTNSENEDQEAQSLDQDPFSILQQAKKILLPDTIAIKQLRDGNFVATNTMPIISLAFHATLPWLLTVGKDRRVRIFEIDGIENRLLYSIHIGTANVISAKFLDKEGKSVVILARRPTLLIWHYAQGRLEPVSKLGGIDERKWQGLEVSPCGRYLAILSSESQIHLRSLPSLQPLGWLQMNSKLLAAAFSPDGTYLFSTGADRLLYQWNLAKRVCVKLIPTNAGSLSTSIAISPDGTYLALGSQTGILDLYDYQQFVISHDRPHISPTPYQTLMNLSTSVTAIKFHPSMQLFLYASSQRKNSVRLVHMHTGRVYRDWPSKTSIRFPHSFAIDCTGKYLAIGDDGGRVLLYSICHFE